MSPNFSNNPNDQIRVEYEHGREIPPSIAIVQAIASIEDIDPMNFTNDHGIRLYDQIDPEALDQLVNHAKGVGTLTVDITLHSVNQYSVHVRDTGSLVVEKDD